MVHANDIVIGCYNLTEIIANFVSLHHADDAALRRMLCKVAAC